MSSVISDCKKLNLFFSIHGNDAAEPVPSDSDNCAETEDGCGGPEYGPSWPATFNSSASEGDQSTIPDEVQSVVLLSFSVCMFERELVLSVYFCIVPFSCIPQERVGNTYALGHVASIPKEQNLPTLFNEGENGQVIMFPDEFSTERFWI